MGKTLRIAKDFSLPVDVVTESISILARKGGGKSYLAAVLAEEMYAASVPFVALDPKGDWWGLRSSSDGNAPGIPITILGGEHADEVLSPERGREVADFVVAYPGWYLLDISQFPSKAAEIRFAADFAERLFRAKAPASAHWPMHFFVDEADVFVPQRTSGDVARCVGAFEVIAKQGRGRGLGVSLISQRAAVVNKNVLTQTEVLAILQTTAPQDRKAVEDWFAGNASRLELDEVLPKLASLPQGTAYFYSPRLLGSLSRAKVRTRNTFDSGRTPKVGEKLIVPKRLAEVDLAELRAKLAVSIEKTKESDPNELRRRIGVLERELRDAKKAVEHRAPAIVERVEVPVFAAGDLDVLRSAQRFYEAALEEADRQVGETKTVLEALGTLIAKVGIEWSSTSKPTAPTRAERPTNRDSRIAKREVPQDRRTGGEMLFDLSKAERSVLSTLVDGPRSKAAIAILSGYSIKSSHFSNTLSSLRTKETIGNASGGTIEITNFGREALGPVEALPTGRALLDYWAARLGKASSAFLSTLVAAYPGDVSAEELSEATGYSLTSSHFSNTISSLRTLGLIEGTRDALRACATLGEEAA